MNPAKPITANGRSLTLYQWADETGLSPKTIYSRIVTLGWSPERALTTRPDRRFGRRGGRPRSGVPRQPPIVREDDRGRAFVRWRSFGRDNYRSFGLWGSPEAAMGYRRFVAEWAAGVHEGKPESSGGTRISTLLLQWLEWAGREFRKLGKETSTVRRCHAVAKVLKNLYADLPAGDFTPACLRAVREVWIGEGKSRKTCNDYTYRTVKLFEWAAGRSLVSPLVYQSLEAVEKIKPGRTAAPDYAKVQHVADDVVAATVAKLPESPFGAVVRSMIAVQRLAGLRPQHLAEMRAGDVRQTGDVWKYTPQASGVKTLHLGKQPAFFFGPKAQAVLAPLLAGKSPTDYVFTHSRNNSERVYRVMGGAYGKAIAAAARAAKVEHWTPHQLRHALATEVAERFQGIGHAAAAIGDTAATAAAVYVHVDPDERAKIEVARAMG